MATIREYFDTDFNNTVRVSIKLNSSVGEVEGVILYDFNGYLSFTSFFVEGVDKDLTFFKKLLDELDNREKTSVNVTSLNNITLPSAKTYPGKLKINHSLKIKSQFFGDTNWTDSSELSSSRRIFIYSESQLSPNEINELKGYATERHINLQFRSDIFSEERSKQEKPLAFICHDSKDKDLIARNIALGLSKKMCPVWYDEFSLNVGDNLRESIEKGLKECKKCVLIISKNFISNGGWTKKEFESIFTREILEEKQLLLPVWVDVTKEEVYDYSPSLLNVIGLKWNELGEEEVCNKLHRAILK